MDVKALNEWAETEAGKKWLDEKKEGLRKKNEQLIKELKSQTSGISELTQRVTDMEKALENKQAELKRSLIDIPLEKQLKEHGVFEILIPQISREISETYGLNINGNANDIKVTGTIKNENETESQILPMNEIVDFHLKTEAGKQYVNPANVKTEIISTTLDVKGGDKPSKTLEGKTGRELAQMSDSDFQDAIKQSMR
jgi:predicted nuclease with TOPRIM domain